MTTRKRIILFAVTPLFVAFCAISFAVRHQAVKLAAEQRASVESAYRASKEAELKHYFSLGMNSIASLYESGNDDEATKEKAKAILAKMDYGDDGYFFIFDLQGTNLMHPRTPDYIGKNFWNMRDMYGNLTIQNLIAKARNGGGLIQYWWQKPSLHKEVPKLGYVVMLDRWGWMLGTGIYLDDVDAALAKIDDQNSHNIQSTMWLLAVIAVSSVLGIALSGLFLNLSESKVAEAKLRSLAQRVVHSQEDERARLSRDLHDGISQELVFVKLQIEAGIAKIAAPNSNNAAAPLLERAAEHINRVLREVRRISHGLRPAILDDLGLAAALDHLSVEFGTDSGIETKFNSNGKSTDLGASQNTALFRIAQEAMTNIKRHANATKIEMRLQGGNKTVELSIADNGCGFAVAPIDEHPHRGIGLRNMHERVEAVGGYLTLTSAPGRGTRIIAVLPKA